MNLRRQDENPHNFVKVKAHPISYGLLYGNAAAPGRVRTVWLLQSTVRTAPLAPSGLMLAASSFSWRWCSIQQGMTGHGSK